MLDNTDTRKHIEFFIKRDIKTIECHFDWNQVMNDKSDR